jgi:hypothetical protein
MAPDEQPACWSTCCDGAAVVRPDTVRFSSRFVGPRPEWANGGVIAGTLAAELAAPAASVRIERPVPIDIELSLEVVDGTVELRVPRGERLAVARSEPALDVEEVPAFVGVDVAATTASAVPREHHPAAGCFACGPQHPSGLDLQPGPVPDGSCLAALLTVRDDLADRGGEVCPPVLWAAMDCPGWYAGCGGGMALLGSMSALQLAPVRAGDRVVVQSWTRGVDGRKVFVGAALYSDAGGLLAASRATWIMTPDLILP